MNRLLTKWFRKWAKKVELSNQSLIDSINDLETGLSTVDLGGHLFKVRVKSKHSGKSSSYRTIIAFKAEDIAIFIYGFRKNEKNNISKNELQYFKKLANDLLSLDSKQLAKAISTKVLFNLEDIK